MWYHNYGCGFQVEICTIANGVTKKEIGNAKDLIVRQLTDETGPSIEMGTINAEDYLVNSFSSSIKSSSFYTFLN